MLWRGEDAYILGGGDSLRHGFDFEILRGKNVIGCNCAVVHGDLLHTVIYGDHAWYHHIGGPPPEGQGLLGGFKGVIVDATEEQYPLHDPTHKRVGRKRYGAACRVPAEAGHLAWNGNTGSCAINLALLYGASRVFLLGFDMKLGKEGKPNWHDIRHEEHNDEVYPRFQRDMALLFGEATEKFPGQEIVNVTDGSDLPSTSPYPRKVSMTAHFGPNWRKIP